MEEEEFGICMGGYERGFSVFGTVGKRAFTFSLFHFMYIFSLFFSLLERIK